MWLYTLSSDQTSFLQFSHRLNDLKATDSHSAEAEDLFRNRRSKLALSIALKPLVGLSHGVCGRASVHVVSELKMTSGFNSTAEDSCYNMKNKCGDLREILNLKQTLQSECENTCLEYSTTPSFLYTAKKKKKEYFQTQLFKINTCKSKLCACLQ